MNLRSEQWFGGVILLAALSGLAASSGLTTNLVEHPPTPCILQEASPAQMRPVRLHIVILQLGPNYLKGKPPQEQPGFGDHAARVTRLAEEGTLVLGGPLLKDFESQEATGALLILQSENAEEARHIAAADPLVAGGIVTIADIRPLLVGAAAWGPCQPQR